MKRSEMPAILTIIKEEVRQMQLKEIQMKVGDKVKVVKVSEDWYKGLPTLLGRVGVIEELCPGIYRVGVRLTGKNSGLWYLEAETLKLL